MRYLRRSDPDDDFRFYFYFKAGSFEDRPIV
jgi:hypothetical protein